MPRIKTREIEVKESDLFPQIKIQIEKLAAEFGKGVHEIDEIEVRITFKERETVH